METLILVPLAKTDLDVDNKAVKKQLRDAVHRLEDDARLRYESLRACLTGFHLTAFLQARAIAAIEKEKPAGETAGFSPADSDAITHPALFDQLRAWRREKAGEMETPPYAVFSQKALYELSHYLPADEKSLLKINGIGAKKVERFGADILKIIRDYCAGNGITDEAKTAFSPPPSKHAPPGDDTRRISLNLLREKTDRIIDEIAAERALTRQTVENHLSHFIAEGELDARLFLPPEKLEKIIDCFRRTPDANLSTVKTALGDDVSYGELHLARAHLRFTERAAETERQQ
ncbi:MAG: HRDC domain-containing protein [Tannerella sp.]|nr:HRDC domain-containing protein [Tannerella sp.]